MPLVLITDANVWIDLQVGKVLAEAVRLDFDLVLPDVIHAELEDSKPAVFEDLSLLLRLEHIRLGKLPPDGVELAERFATRYWKPQSPDLFALAMAKLEEAILVTGDRDLREAAEAEEIEVHGTLWLMDAMVKQKVLTARRAYSSLRRMLKRERRLPEGECRKLMRRWSQK
jgi:hypothetical protein